MTMAHDPSADASAPLGESIIKRAVEQNDPALAKEALREIDSLLESSSDSNQRIYLRFSKVSCYRILGDYEEARRQIGLALRERSDERTQATSDLMQGLLFQQEGRYLEAFECFSSLLSAHPELINTPDLRFMYEDIQQRRGFLLTTLGRFREAIPILLEVLSFTLKDSIRSETFASIGLCYLELKKYDLAAEHLSQAVAIGLTEKWMSPGHFYLGIAYFYRDMFHEAKREFQTCERLASRYAVPITDVYSWLSNISGRLGEVSESKRYARLSKVT